MNLAFDPDEWTATPIRGDALAENAHPEWHVLRARMRVAVETWAALSQARADRAPGRFGSFSRRATRSLGRMDDTCGVVNQTSSANRKCGGSTFPIVAELSSIGGRG